MRRGLLILVLLLSVLPVLGQTSLYTHNFASDSNSTTLPSGWVVDTGTMDINGGKLRCTAGPCIAHYAGATFTADQYASIKASAWTTSVPGVLVRYTSSTSAYWSRCSSASGGTCNTASIYRADTSGSLISASSAALTSTTLYTLKATGTTVAMMRDTTQLNAVTSSLFASGYPGVYFPGSSTTSGITYIDLGITGNPTEAAPTITSSGQTVTISGTGTKCFTEDGSAPSINAAGSCTTGTTYTGPFTRSTSSTVTKAVAGSGSTGQSTTATYNWASVPTILPASGTTFFQKWVTMTCPTPGNTIRYTRDGTAPTGSSTAYPGLTAPTYGTFTTASTGGSLANGIFSYRVSSVNASGETIPAVAQSITVPLGTSTNTVTVVWNAVTGATGYKVYGRSSGAEQLLASTASTSWTDSGAVMPSGAVPTQDTTGFQTVATGSETIQAYCSASGYGDSLLASASYTVAPALIQTVTDDLSAYWQTTLENDPPNYTSAGVIPGGAADPANGEYQFPLDQYWTGGNWTQINPLTGSAGVKNYGFIVPAKNPFCLAPGSTPCAAGGGGTGVLMAANSSTPFSADHYAAVSVKSSAGNGAGGVGARLQNNSGYVLLAATSGGGSGSGSVHFGRVDSGVPLWLCDLSGLTLPQVSTVELAAAGSSFRPRIDGAAIPGCAAEYTDTTYPQGNPGIATYGGASQAYNAYVYGFQAGNVGATTVANSTPAQNWSYATYNSQDPNDPRWMMYGKLRGYWAKTQTYGGVTGWGGYGVDFINSVGTVIQMFQAPFKPSGHYQKWRVRVDGFEPALNNWFMPVASERWTPGMRSYNGQPSGCAQAGNAFCDDELAIYPGVQSHAQLIAKKGRAADCGESLGLGSKSEFSCMPTMHVTMVVPGPGVAVAPTADHTINACGTGYNPTLNPWGCNKVLTLASSWITPQAGDYYYDSFVNGRVQVACKRFGDNVGWQSNHAQALNDVIAVNGHLFIASNSGTTGGTQPTFTPTWDTVNYHGTAAVDGSVTWWYYGDECPTKDSWSLVIDAQAPTAFQGRKSFPGVWFGFPGPADAPSVVKPIISDWEAGSADETTACSLLGLCNTSGTDPILIFP